ncbi:hypothetical protein ACKKBF_B19105 [Auxenochlorella protothecoides x Auxenochlorella symbiontica]
MEPETGGAPSGAEALSAGDLRNMLGQCLKLASENKITAKNTWGLPLIEHLDDLIKAEPDSTNFQRASVTLDAGVKIYGTRVDSVHTETFKILGGLGRAAAPEEALEDGAQGEEGVGEGATSRRRKVLALDQNATLESSLDALNLKQFDLAFDVDPLFQQTSAQFDEGGAQGLLLNTFGVFRGCEVMFDSSEVPEQALAPLDPGPPQQLDLSGLEPALTAWRDELARLGPSLLAAPLCPSLARIQELAGEPAAPVPQAAAEAEALVASALQPEASGDAQGPQPAASAASCAGATDDAMAYHDDADTQGVYDGHDDGDHGGDGGGYDSDSAASEAGAVHVDPEPGHTGGEGLAPEALHWLLHGGGPGAEGGPVPSGLPSGTSKGWAGAAHWRFRPGAGAAAENAAGGGGEVDRGPRKERRAASGRSKPLDFVSLMAAGPAPTFAMLAAEKKVPARRSAKKADAQRLLLPEDYHCKAEMMFHYALRPRTLLLSGLGAGLGQGGEEEPGLQEWADLGQGGAEDDNDDDGHGDFGGWEPAGADADGATLELVQAARQVEKVDIQYARAAKHVDVRALKELMWGGLQRQLAAGHGASPDRPAQLQALLSEVPQESAAGPAADISVHLCFICVLHLANEHGLAIRGVPTLDRLMVYGTRPTAAA